MLKKYPFYIKSTVILFGLTLFVYSLFNLKEILIPLSFALMLAILLNPLVNRLERWKIKKVYAIAIAILVAFFALTIIFYFLSSQIMRFSDQVPVLKNRFAELFSQFQHVVQNDMGMSMQKQNELLQKANENLQPLLGHLLGTMLGSLTVLFLLPVYAFLFLFYKTLILNFLFEVFAEENSKEVNLILQQTKGAIQSYMTGLVIESLIVATLNTIALLLLGVPYAVLLGVLGAILNILPYIGGIIAIALPLIIATITKEGFHTQFGIIIAYAIIQFVDNHFLIPYIVSSKVRINALISIIGVLLGAGVWGISGMFLSIPFIGVLKIIFDRIPDLKPWGKLLGDSIPTNHKGHIWLLRKRAAKVVITPPAATTTTTTNAKVSEVISTVKEQ